MENPSINKFLSSESLYKQFLSPILSSDDGVDAEQLTNAVLGTLGQASIFRDWPGISNALTQLEKELTRQDIRLQQRLFGCSFKNPIGLAAGFDKNGVAAAIWSSFGFGFAELGTITFHSQPGNPKPRLFRLANEQAALNRMGFNNIGAHKILGTLKRQKIKKPGERNSIIGLNLGKSKVTPIDQASDDYAASLELLAHLADYVVINISSPNTPRLRELQEVKRLRQLINRLRRSPGCPPLLIKISPDLKNNAIDELAGVAYEEGIAGIIAVNTSVNRFGLEKRVINQSGLTLSEENGGLSGAPLRERAIEVIKRLRISAGKDLPLIGVGGIDSPKSAWERITAGASLIQIYTGWIFKGPNLVPQILEGILNQLDRHGLKNISQAIGSDAPWI